MILTITANAALDRVLFIDEFQPGMVAYTQKVVDCVGGKGFDSSVVLKALGVPQLAMGFMAGDTGRYLAGILKERYAIPLDLVWVEGDTRIAHVVVEMKHHRHSHITTQGYSVPFADQQAFIRKFSAQVGSFRWVIAAGSLASGLQPDFYAQLIRIAAQAGVCTLIDCPGEPALKAAEARPAILKMNRAEFGRTFGASLEGMNILQLEVQKVLKHFELPAMVITCGAEGILAVLPGEVWLASSPRQEEVNSAGAGDGVSAALAWRLGLGDGWGEALRWAAATSAAVVMTEGTADCYIEDIQRIYSQVRVEKLSSGLLA